MSEFICPIMSCRVTRIEDPKNPVKLVPTVVKCQESDCAWWVETHECCVILYKNLKQGVANELSGRDH